MTKQFESNQDNSNAVEKEVELIRTTSKKHPLPRDDNFEVSTSVFEKTEEYGLDKNEGDVIREIFYT